MTLDPTRQVMARHIGHEAVAKLMAAKETERKEDPDRRQGLHGPYEELVIFLTGKMPNGYFEAGDPEPWGMLVPESRRNIVWQITAGLMDSYPDVGAAYLSLAMAQNIDGCAYAQELKGIHAHWRNVLETTGTSCAHGHHQAIGKDFHRISCSGCSALGAVALESAAMRPLFDEMAKMTPEDRREHIVELGLTELLYQVIPDDVPQLIT